MIISLQLTEFKWEGNIKTLCNTTHDLPATSANFADNSLAQLNCGDQQGSEGRFCSLKSFSLRVAEFL
jgi:hypothetical protein